MSFRAKYPGTCAKTGQRYSAGTLIEKAGKGYQIVAGAHVANFRRVRLAPVPPATEPVERTMDINRPIYCSCCKSRPGFDEKDAATYADCAFAREGNKLTCPQCGRTGEILPPTPKPEPEKRRCWECGREFTYAECKRDGGDWNENGGYCGC